MCGRIFALLYILTKIENFDVFVELPLFGSLDNSAKTNLLSGIFMHAWSTKNTYTISDEFEVLQVLDMVFVLL